MLNSHLITYYSMQAHGAMTAAKRQSRAKDYVAGGRKLESWSMWVALETYMQVREFYSVEKLSFVHTPAFTGKK